ncbi:MAG: hypothetical protein MUF18_05735 [Fimbriiglobus sp.]|jgi:hypothetical protein|nr:hypothetical protein [Fimbriiglobus sp.]
MARLLLAVLLAFPVVAADPPKGGGSVQMIVAKIEGERFMTSTTVSQPRVVPTGDRSITVTETTTTTVARELKYLKATDPDDKEIPADELKSRLKEPSPVVFLNTPLDPTWKAKFKRGTIFVEYAAPKEEPKKDEKK